MKISCTDRSVPSQEAKKLLSQRFVCSYVVSMARDLHWPHSQCFVSIRPLTEHQLGPPVAPFLTVSFWGEGSPTKIDYSKKGTLILTSLQDLDQLFRVST